MMINDKMSNIVFVNMPFCSMERPSLALGLLSSILKQSNIDSTILDAQLELMERIDLKEYYQINKLPSWYSITDWIFARTAFPDHVNKDAEFLHLIFEICEKEMVPFYRNKTESEFVDLFMAIRDICEKFLNDIAEEIESSKPSILACTSTFMQHVASIALCRSVKELNPEVITLLGGANCETQMGVTTHKHFTSIDYVVSGEADDIIVPLVKAIGKYGLNVPPDETPLGVFTPWHRKNDYPNLGNASGKDPYPRAVAQSLDNLPAPNYDNYFERIAKSPKLSGAVTSCIPLETSRGCFWGKCRFCGLNGVGEGQRLKSSSQVIKEIELLSRKYGVNRIEIVDNVMHPSHASALMNDLSKRRGKYRIFHEIRSTMKKSDVALMTDACICWVQAGIESLHSNILDTMNKGTKSRHNIQILKWARQFGIRVHWSLLYGFPKEKDSWYDEMADLIPLLAHLEPPGGSSIVRYSRYSTYFNNPEEFNLRLIPYPFYKYIYPLGDKELSKLVYYFEDEDAMNKEKSILLARSFRSGLKRAKHQTVIWQDLFSKNAESRPVLMIVRKEPTVQIVDTRPVAKANFFDLDEIQSKIYLECDAAKSVAKLNTLFSDLGVSDDAFNEAVASLISNQLVIKTDDHILSLALEFPYDPFVTWADFPMGYWRGTITREGEDC